ncbi:MAG TPA: type I DNA topoisomerase, partial [Candidatus Paceibacterota bacterium]|nr:type I DNA topoisomerase [Candidatus Paceibacterota bacterium]
ESPSKAKTIEKYLDGKYTVRASIGHVRDLPKTNKDAIDIAGGFIPRYEISVGKHRVISELQTLARKAEEIILSPDPDREGEAIAWHLKEILNDKSIKAPIKRVTFNEITKDAIIEALQHPREIDYELVQAQEARRVLDRLVGYDLSGLIWKKVRYGLSAGRVQSPALRIIMEKEREIRAFVPEQYWTIEGLFSAGKEQFPLSCSIEPRELKDVQNILELGKKHDWHVTDIKTSEQKRTSRAPFTTSTLQQTASTRLGFSPSRTMQVAQKLYEEGHITYMRTDSTNLSAQAQAQILALVEKKYGKEFVQAKTYATKSKNAQEAHEAIRPTHIDHLSLGFTEEQKSLYTLIWERAVSSQMSDAKMLKTKLIANITTNNIPDFSANGSRILFPGWLIVDTAARGEDVELPKLSVGQKIDLVELEATEKATQPPNRYTEAGLIKELEERGIGRPSTYASIMRTLEDRGYVKKEGRTLFPTDTGDVVSSFLETNFPTYISDTFTAEMENELDEIANGERQYIKTLSDFYGPFSAEVAKKDKLDKATNLGDAEAHHACPKCGSPMIIKLGRSGKFLSCGRYPDCDGALTMDGQEVGKEKPFGIHPTTGENIYLMSGRFGAYVQQGEMPEKPKLTKFPKGHKKTAEDKELVKREKELIEQAKDLPMPRRASLPPKMNPSDVTMDIALKLLELPRSLGNDPESNEPIIANVGRFGPYVGRGRNFRSIKKPFDAYGITLEQALTLLNTPKQLPKGTELITTFIHPKSKREMQVLKSKSGHFIKAGLKRIYLPDNLDPTIATTDELVALLGIESAKGKKK